MNTKSETGERCSLQCKFIPELTHKKRLFRFKAPAQAFEKKYPAVLKSKDTRT